MKAPKATAATAKPAVQGEKMIEVRVRFWTDDIAPKKGEIIPKHALTSGVVNVERNESHGIKPIRWLPFHSLLDLGAVIEKTLIAQGIVLHVGAKMGKYIDRGKR